MVSSRGRLMSSRVLEGGVGPEENLKPTGQARPFV